MALALAGVGGSAVLAASAPAPRERRGRAGGGWARRGPARGRGGPAGAAGVWAAGHGRPEEGRRRELARGARYAGGKAAATARASVWIAAASSVPSAVRRLTSALRYRSSWPRMRSVPSIGRSARVKQR